MKYLVLALLIVLITAFPTGFVQAQETDATTIPEEDVVVRVVLGAKDATAEDIGIAYKVIAKRLHFLGLKDAYLGKFDKKKITLYIEPFAYGEFLVVIDSFTNVGGLDFSLVKAESADVLPDELTVTDLQEAAFDESDIEDVDVLLSEYSGEPELLLKVKASSQDEFEDFTQLHIGEMLVVSSGDTILMSPVIQTGLRESAVISGNNIFESLKDAERLALSVYSGRLPMELELLEVEEVARAKAKY